MRYYGPDGRFMYHMDHRLCAQTCRSPLAGRGPYRAGIELALSFYDFVPWPYRTLI